MGMLRADLWNALFIVINLIVLYLLMKKFLVNPIMNVIQKRDDMIKSELKNAEDLQTEANALKSRWEHEISGAKEKSSQIVEQAKKDAQSEYERILSHAGKQADKLIEEARSAMETERESTLQEVQSQISELAVLAAEKILEDKKTDEVNSAIYDSFLSEAGDENDSE